MVLATQDKEITLAVDKTLRLTVAQALLRYLSVQQTELLDGGIAPLFGGMWGIFGHGNLPGIAEALYQYQNVIPFYRGQNEQGIAHIATAFAKTHCRRRCMGVTTSIGPGATNLVSAAATAYVNQLPLLLLPGDTFTDRFPDPVLQQIENSYSPLITANDCLKPVSRYFDRITCPEQLFQTLPQAIRTLTDPLFCGPVTLAMPQDTQTRAWDFPADFFNLNVHYIRRSEPDKREVECCARILRQAKCPLVICGGGVAYSGAGQALSDFCTLHHIPFAETQAGKGTLPGNHSQNLGGIGVTGTHVANNVARQADVILCIGTRLTDFTTCSKTLFTNPDATFIGLNISSFDAIKLQGAPLICDAKQGLNILSQHLTGYRATEYYETELSTWHSVQKEYCTYSQGLPTDAQVVAAVNASTGPKSIVVGAAGGLPGELHKHWKTQTAGGYHMEYGYSCMGYEIAGGIGVKLARPDADVFVMLGDGSYLMLHTELLTAVHMGIDITVILLNNSCFGCINRLQKHLGSASFGNALNVPVDFVANAKSYGCYAEKIESLTQLDLALRKKRAPDKPSIFVIDTDPEVSTPSNVWWNVPVAETSPYNEVYKNYVISRKETRF